MYIHYVTCLLYKFEHSKYTNLVFIFVQRSSASQKQTNAKKKKKNPLVPRAKTMQVYWTKRETELRPTNKDVSSHPLRRFTLINLNCLKCGYTTYLNDIIRKDSLKGNAQRCFVCNGIVTCGTEDFDVFAFILVYRTTGLRCLYTSYTVDMKTFLLFFFFFRVVNSWLFGWLIGCLIRLPVGCVRLVGWLNGWMVRLVGWLARLLKSNKWIGGLFCYIPTDFCNFFSDTPFYLLGQISLLYLARSFHEDQAHKYSVFSLHISYRLPPEISFRDVFDNLV